MNICKDCHDKQPCGFVHMFISRGPCEVCKKTRECYDCRPKETSDSFPKVLTPVGQLPPKTQTIIPPKDGWKAHTYYQVRVAHNPHNPVHEAVFAVGFLNEDGRPGGYSLIWNSTYDSPEPCEHVHYLGVVMELFTEDR